MDGGFILFLCLCGQLGFRDFDILNIFYDELEIEKMAKFEILIATNGLSSRWVGGGWINLLQTVPQGLVLTFDI